MADWEPIFTAPFDRDLELAVIDREEPHALSFPCRRIFGGWINAETKKSSVCNCALRIGAVGTKCFSA